MPHTITLGPSPDIVCVTIIGALNYDDMTCEVEIGLNERPLFIFLDVSKMDSGLPEDFLEGARVSFFVHPNMRHLAIYTDSVMLNMIATMVSKVTHRQDKLTTHKSIQAALDHLLKLSHAPASVR